MTMDADAWTAWSARVEQRLARLEKWQKARDADLRFPWSDDEFEQFLAEVIARVADARIMKWSCLHDEGVWAADRRYEHGAFVSCNGAGWIAQMASTGVRPGVSDAWRLAVKSDLAELKREVRQEVAKQLNGHAR